LLFHQLVKEGKDKKEAVADVLSKVGLSPDVMSRYPHQFSGGQKQRVCIARALCLKPELIVCDEAVSALDVSIQAQILNLLIDLKKSERLSYLFIAHDLHLVQEVSDDVTVMYLGKVMESGKSKEVFNNPKHPYTQALLSSIPHVDPSKRKTKIALKGEIPSPVNPPSGCPFRTRCPYAKPECALPPPLKRPSQTHRYFCIL
jgi:oligopeptide/dipeptide ABC transporter ATP-binding protein